MSREPKLPQQGQANFFLTQQIRALMISSVCPGDAAKNDRALGHYLDTDQSE